MRLGEPELFSSFLPASDRSQLSSAISRERRFGTGPRGVTYDEDLRRSVHEWDSRETKKQSPKEPHGVKDEAIIA